MKPSEQLAEVIRYMRAYFTPADYGGLQRWLITPGTDRPLDESKGKVGEHVAQKGGS